MPRGCACVLLLDTNALLILTLHHHHHHHHHHLHHYRHHTPQCIGAQTNKIVSRAVARTASQVFRALVEAWGSLRGRGAFAGEGEGEEEDKEAEDEQRSLGGGEWMQGSVSLRDVQLEALLPEIREMVQTVRFELLKGQPARGEGEEGVPQYPTDAAQTLTLPLWRHLLQSASKLASSGISSTRSGREGIVPESRLQTQRRVLLLISQGFDVQSEQVQALLWGDSAEDPHGGEPPLGPAWLDHQPLMPYTRQHQLATAAAAAAVNPFVPFINTATARSQRAKDTRPVEVILQLKGRKAERELAAARERIQQAEDLKNTFAPIINAPPRALRHVAARIDMTAPSAAPPPAPVSTGFAVRATKKSQAIAAAHSVRNPATAAGTTSLSAFRQGSNSRAASATSSANASIAATAGANNGKPSGRGRAMEPHLAPPRPQEVAQSLQQVQWQSQRAAQGLTSSSSASASASASVNTSISASAGANTSASAAVVQEQQMPVSTPSRTPAAEATMPQPATASAPPSSVYAAPPLPAEVAQQLVARALERELGLPAPA